MAKKLPGTFYNPISIFGAAIALLSLGVFFLLLLINMFAKVESMYLGIVALVVIPVVLIFGLVLIPIGTRIERRRLAKQRKEAVPMRIDLGDPRHRRAAVIFVMGTGILLLLTAFGSYKVYEFSESVTFCGTTCHAVMAPEHTAYQGSPHARVKCVECHIGGGTEWYVRAKFSGARQLFAVAFDTYHRPISTPVKNLRPSEGTCEQCHWPDKFVGRKAKLYSHFMADEHNSKWDILMLLKTGGSRENGAAEDIHRHTALQIDYIATDDHRQEIAWLRVRDEKGEEREYVNQENPLNGNGRQNHAMRRMDCIDCHNRPAHIYRSPVEAVNLAFVNGKIDSTLPSAKKFAVEALVEDYSSQAEGLSGVAKKIAAVYREQYPNLVESRQRDIDQIVAATQEIYAKNIFPEMKVRWDTHPDNLGHFSSKGCDRCHKGQFVSKEGATISNDCNLCHLIVAQGDPQTPRSVIAPQGLRFEHPVDIGDAWTEVRCWECHTGGADH